MTTPPNRPRVTVVVPAYNEEATVGETLRRVLASPWTHEVLVVDDGSTDGTVATVAAIDDARIRLLHHDSNHGKSVALRTAFAEARGDILIVQDADLEYDPADWDRLLQPIVAGHADVVYGSRFLGAPRRTMMYWHYMGNRFLTFVANVLNDLNLSDMETGAKAFRREILDEITLQSRGFDFEPEFTTKVARAGCRIYEVPVSYHGRDFRAGKKITWRDGITALGTLFKARFWSPQ